jgi:hypothetical protein
MPEDTQRTESIKNLLAHIDKGNIVLPEFQRNFVWDYTKTYDLFDSFVRDIFIGSIIYGVPSFEISARGIDTRPRRGKGSRAKIPITSYDKNKIDELVQIDNFRLLLDGQQRVTSIYRALKGFDDVWFIANNQNSGEGKTLEECLLEFAGRESDEHLSIKLHDIYLMMDGAISRESQKEEILKKSLYGKKLNVEQFDNTFSNYLDITNKLQDLCKADKLMSYYLLNTSAEKFSLFFERSNSKGIQLNFIDILAAKLYSGFNLREKIEEYENQNQGITLTREVIVRAISYLVSNGKEIGRNYILQNLNCDHFNEYWDEICGLYTKAVNYLLENNFVIGQSWLVYENMLVPLIIFLKNLPQKEFSQASEAQTQFIKYWFWASILSQRYGGITLDTILRDSNALGFVAKEEKIPNTNYFKTFMLKVDNEDDLLNVQSKRSALYQGILNLVNYGNGRLLDWKNSNKISTSEKIDDHHIFPQAYLRNIYNDSDDETSLIDSVVNRTVIPKITNVKIGKKSPSAYLQEIRKNNSKLVDSLNSHLIPESLLDGKFDDDYEGFLKERASMIMDLVAEHVEAPENVKMAYETIRKSS